MDKCFENTMRILSNSINSIDSIQFCKLIDSCELALRGGGQVIASGLGKNVPVCEKFEGAMLSLGLQARFMHTNSAVHGDLGMVHKSDVVILLSKSGTTAETIYLASLLKKRGCIIWLLTFNGQCPLAKDLLNVISLKLEHEGDPWNIMPNNSTVLNLIVLQTLAIELGKRMGVHLEDFKVNHPGGAIGEYLRSVE